MENSKKLVTLIGIVVTVVVILSAILIVIILLELNNELNPRISLNPSEVTESILKGTTKQVTLSATVIGQIVQEEGSTTVPNYEWSIDNEKVATLTAADKEATLVLKAGGSAVVTVTYGDLSKTCNINVTELVSQITLNKTKINEVLEGGTTKEIKLTATPHNIPELTEQSGNSAAKLKWESSNTKVAVIEADGNVANITLKGKGKTVITATYKDLSAQCEINVIEVDIKQSNVNINKGKTTTLTISEYTPKEEIVWASSDKKIATVNGGGIVTGVAVGTASITIKHIDTGITDTCTVNVSDLKINQNSVTINKGKTTKLTLSKDSPTGITWSSSNKKIATVDKNGVVTGVAGGTVTITAKSSVTGATDTCVVNVKAVEITQTSANVKTGATLKLVLSKHAPSGTITWSSSNPKVATVSSAGVVTGVAGGTVTITAKHSGTGLSDKCTVKIAWPTLGELVKGPDDYGKTVDYTAGGISAWQVYYEDTKNGYVFLTTSKSVGATHKLRTVASLTEAQLKLYNIFRLGKNNTFKLSDPHPSDQLVASLIGDYGVYANTTTYGKNVVGAIGCPTAELLVAAWNQKGYKPTMTINFRQGGYGIDCGNKIFTTGTIYLLSEAPHWLAAPNNVEDVLIAGAVQHLGIGIAQLPDATYGIRPVVCLKSSTPAINGTKTDFSLIK